MTRVRITSRRHPWVQKCRQIAAGRGEPGLVLLDGEHVIREAWAGGVSLEVVLAESRDGVPAHEALAREAARRGVEVFDAAGDVLEAASPVRSPTGVVAVARWEPAGVSSLFATSHALVLGLVDVQDPGNVGGVIRSAHGLGASGVVAIGTSADPGGWRAVRASMGSVFRLPTARSGLVDVAQQARRAGVRIAATTVECGISLVDADLGRPLLVLVGNEGAGLPELATTDSDLQLTIPMASGANSLNVAVSAALVLWEARRQERRS